MAVVRTAVAGTHRETTRFLRRRISSVQYAILAVFKMYENRANSTAGFLALYSRVQIKKKISEMGFRQWEEVEHIDLRVFFYLLIYVFFFIYSQQFKYLCADKLLVFKIRMCTPYM